MQDGSFFPASSELRLEAAKHFFELAPDLQLPPDDVGHATNFFALKTRSVRHGADRINNVFVKENVMELLVQAAPVAAAGYSLVYLLAGGGFFGAFVIFVVAKMLGR
jgi:hypothetical protein